MKDPKAAAFGSLQGWLDLNQRDDGVKVRCLQPLGYTPMYPAIVAELQLLVKYFIQRICNN